MDVKSLQEIKNCSEESGEWRKVCKSNVLKRKKENETKQKCFFLCLIMMWVFDEN